MMTTKTRTLSGEGDLLEQSFELFQKILSNGGKLDINRKIRHKMNRLYRQHGFSADEVLNILVEWYLLKKLGEKHQLENALSTFIVHSINYTLSSLLRKCDTHRRHYSEISLEKLLRDMGGNLDEVSLDFLTGIGAESLVDFTTPEEMIIGKELLELMINHYGLDDVLVLLGYESRQAAADRLEMPYDTFCKRLLRKTLLFLPVLHQAGYFISE